MTIEPAVLYALGTFALVGGRVCGGIQWHHWNRARRRARRSPEQASAEATPA